MAAPKKIDWERIEPEWRAGIKSVLQIAADYEKDTGQKVSHTAINKHFKQLKVPRDLAAKIRAKAAAIVSASMVSGLVSTETTARDSEIIDESAIVVANVELSQRRDIQRSRQLAMSLLAELEETTDNRELFKQLGEILSSGDDESAAKMSDIYRKVTSMPMRIDSMKKLAETLKVLIGLEREAFGINDGEKVKPASILADALKVLNEQSV